MKQILAIFLLLCGLAQAAPTEVRVFQLNNRPAMSAMEMVKPLLTPAGTVLPDERTNKLIVRDTPEVLAQVEQLLQQIDVAAPQVMINVAFTGETPGSRDVYSVDYRNRPDRVGVTASSTDTYASTQGQQKVMVMSGERARIVVGRQLTYVQPYVLLAHSYGLLVPSVMVQNVTTGFEVSPTVIGDSVTVQITPWFSYDSAQGPGEVLFSEAATTVRVRSGDSVMIASGSSSNASRSSGGGAAASASFPSGGPRLDAVSAILGATSESSAPSASMVLTPTIVPDWSVKE